MQGRNILPVLRYVADVSFLLFQPQCSVSGLILVQGVDDLKAGADLILLGDPGLTEVRLSCTE